MQRVPNLRFTYKSKGFTLPANKSMNSEVLHDQSQPVNPFLHDTCQHADCMVPQCCLFKMPYKPVLPAFACLLCCTRCLAPWRHGAGCVEPGQCLLLFQSVGAHCIPSLDDVLNTGILKYSASLTLLLLECPVAGFALAVLCGISREVTVRTKPLRH